MEHGEKREMARRDARGRVQKLASQSLGFSFRGRCSEDCAERGSSSKASLPSGPSRFNQASNDLPALLVKPLMKAVGFPASKALTCAGDDPRFHAEIACQLVAVSLRGIRRLLGGEAQPSVGIPFPVVERV